MHAVTPVPEDERRTVYVRSVSHAAQRLFVSVYTLTLVLKLHMTGLCNMQYDKQLVLPALQKGPYP